MNELLALGFIAAMLYLIIILYRMIKSNIEMDSCILDEFEQLDETLEERIKRWGKNSK